MNLKIMKYSVLDTNIFVFMIYTVPLVRIRNRCEIVLGYCGLYWRLSYQTLMTVKCSAQFERSDTNILKHISDTVFAPGGLARYRGNNIFGNNKSMEQQQHNTSNKRNYIM